MDLLLVQADAAAQHEGRMLLGRVPVRVKGPMIMLGRDPLLCEHSVRARPCCGSGTRKCCVPGW
jgi:hypothetical protein